MKNLSVKPSNALDAKLAALARQRGMTKCDVVQSALKAYFARSGGRKGGSALDLARDLAGCLEPIRKPLVL